MPRRLCVLVLMLAVIGCASTSSGPRITTIALAPGGGLLLDTLEAELFDRGFILKDLSVSEPGMATSPSLLMLSGKGVDALQR